MANFWWKRFCSLAVCCLAVTSVSSVNIDAPPQQMLTSGSDGLVICAAKPVAGEEIDRTVWKDKNYREIHNGGRYSISDEGLTISGVQASDSGLYICEVKLAKAVNNNHGMFYQKFIDVSVE